MQVEKRRGATERSRANVDKGTMSQEYEKIQIEEGTSY